MVLNEGLFKSDQSSWETPKILFDTLNSEFHFSLDVCASKENTKCKNFLAVEGDSLLQDWTGRCWMNPPYGRGIEKWVEKAYQSIQSSAEVVVCLLPCRTDTRWWHNFVMKSYEIRLLTRRLTFEGAGNKAPFPASIVIFSPHQNKWPYLKVQRI